VWGPLPCHDDLSFGPTMAVPDVVGEFSANWVRLTPTRRVHLGPSFFPLHLVCTLHVMQKS
jgi:hypothetical protein